MSGLTISKTRSSFPAREKELQPHPGWKKPSFPPFAVCLVHEMVSCAVQCGSRLGLGGAMLSLSQGIIRGEIRTGGERADYRVRPTVGLAGPVKKNTAQCTSL